MTTTSRSEPRARWVFRRRSQWRRSLRVVVVALVVGFPAACRSSKGVFGCGHPSGTPGEASSVARPQPAAPVELVADLVIRNPGETWRALRAMGGKDVAMLPQSYSLMVATLLGLPPAAAATLDEGGPVLGAVLDTADGPSMVMGLHVQRPEELLAALSRGSDAPFSVSSASGIDELVPRPGADVENVRLAVDEHYLLVAPRSRELSVAGRYLAETLAGRALPSVPLEVSIGHAALERTLAAGLRERWRSTETELAAAVQGEQRRRGGRAADLADPSAVLGMVGTRVRTLCDVVAGARSMDVRLEPLTSSLLVRIDLDVPDTGVSRDWVSSIPVGGIDALTTLPRDVAAALWLDAPFRSNAAEIESVLAGVFGPRISAADTRAAADVLARAARLFGDSATLGLVSGSFVLQTKVADATEAEGALRAVFDLLKSPPFAQPIAQILGRPSVTVTQGAVTGIRTPVTRAHVSFARRGAPTASLRVSWTIDRGALHLAAGEDVEPALAALVDAFTDPARALAGRPEITALRRSLGDQAAAVLVLDPARLGLEPTGASAGVVLGALGRSNQTAWFRVEIPAAAVSELTRRLLVR